MLDKFRAVYVWVCLHEHVLLGGAVNQNGIAWLREVSYFFVLKV